MGRSRRRSSRRAQDLQRADLSAALAAHGVDPPMSRRLEEEGIEKFNVAFDKLNKALAEKMAVAA